MIDDWVKKYDEAGDFWYAINEYRGGISLPVCYVGGDIRLGYAQDTEEALARIAGQHGIDVRNAPVDAWVEDTQPPEGYDAVEGMIYGAGDVTHRDVPEIEPDSTSEEDVVAF